MDYRIRIPGTNRGISASAIITILIGSAAIYYYSATKQLGASITSNGEFSSFEQHLQAQKEPLSALQKHVLFWDRDADNIIYPHHVYNGFREIGFNIPFAITSLLIPVFFSYPTRLGHSYFPDPLFRIYVDSINKAKHGSDTSVYDSKGNLRDYMFEEMFEEFDSSGRGGLSPRDLLRMIGNNRVAADPAGWTFAAMEWSTTWLLLQKDGRVWKEDLKQCYNGSLFWRLKEEREHGKGAVKGYGPKDFFRDPKYIFSELWGQPVTA